MNARAALFLLLFPLLSACSESAGSSRVCSGVALDGAALVLASSFQASGLGRIDEAGCLTEIPDIKLGGDPSLSLGLGGPFVVARSESLVFAIDPVTLSITDTLLPYADEAERIAPFVLASCSDRQTKGINAHDVDRDANGSLWVARYEKPTLGIVRPDGGFDGVVDLSMFADADGLPEAEAIRVVGDHVFVALELLDRCNAYVPTGNGIVVGIDVATRAVQTQIDLGGRNPFGRMKPVPWDPTGSAVVIALPGLFSAIEPGNAAVLVDLQKGEVTTIAQESVFGGSVAEVVLAAPDEGYAIVAGTEQENPTAVVAFDPSTGIPKATLLDSRTADGKGNYNHSGLAIVGAHLLVGDRAYGATAIHVIERKTGLEVGTLFPARLPPVSLAEAP